MNYRKARSLTCHFLYVFSALAIAGPIVLADGKVAEIDIPYQKFVLDNGLRLIVHEDHKAPIVAVNVWYHVGSKNEKPGITGFAHLFEHLMFNGTEHYDDEYFRPFERVGATDMNGTTNCDRTNYFQNVPSSAIDLALWMESDRMGHLLGAITQEKLDEQRGVVQNEKRQGENQPYGKMDLLMAENTYPSGHPYSWTVIGSMEDLEAASLEDVREWFRSHYGAGNAVIAIAGDVDTQTVKKKVETYFGAIPAGPPLAKQEVWIAKRTGTHRQRMEDRVPQARIDKVWNVPQWGSADADFLRMVGEVLATGKTSRLYKRLVYDDQLATGVSASVWLREIAGQFFVGAFARPGVGLAKVEKAIDEELARFLADGPTEKELQRVRTQLRADFIRGIERIGGFGGKSDVLAKNEVYGQSPDFYKTSLRRIAEATADDLRATARRWLSDGVYILEVHPFADYKTAASNVDRSKLPEPAPPPEAKFPELARAALANGLKLILARRVSIPQIRFELLIDAGYAADQFALPGTAGFAMAMLEEGTQTRTALQISDDLAMLGAELYAGANLDMASVSLNTLKENLDGSLEVFADVVLHPTFPQKELDRLRKRRLAMIKQEKAHPRSMAQRVLPGLLYGKGHAYGNPASGSGTEASVAKLTREDLVKFRQTWFKPNNATLVIVGDTTLKEITPKLEALFNPWKQGDVPEKDIAPVAHQPKSVVYLIDRPNAIQSNICAAHIAPPKADPDDVAMQAMNRVLGGSFTSRINMNLREDKHWSYGAGSSVIDARAQRAFLVSTSVQTDKTSQSMVEIAKELSGMAGARPVTTDELNKAKAAMVLKLPGSWETMQAVARSIGQIVRFGLDDRYFDGYPHTVKGLTLDKVSAVAKRVIRPDKLVWVIIGDRSKIEQDIRRLGYGEVYLIDADGNLVG